MAEFDVSNYLGVFLDEVDEQLQILDAEILHLEKDPNNVKTIENIFRAAHTLKGSSASMGFEKMKECTHHLENIFDQIRQKKIQVTPSLVNVIFDCIDLIRRMKESIIDGTLDDMDIQPFIEQLEALHTNQAIHNSKLEQVQLAEESKLDEYQKDVLRNGLTLGHNAFEIKIQLFKDSLMKSVRALLIQNAISEMGEIIASFPSVEVMENEDAFQGNMCFVVLTMRTKEELLDCISQLSEIEKSSITEISKTAFFNEPTSPKEQKEAEDAKSNQKEKANKQKKKISSTVRVDVERLEYLMNLVGELVIDQTRLVDVRGRFSQMGMNTEDEFEILDDVTNHLTRVISELQEGMMKTRMLPIEQLFNRFPRMVRDTARQAGKEIDFVMEGKETELDRTLIEEISDPIIHLLRNAIDHGIESPEEREKLGKPANGRVVLRAFHEENHIVISITDDGRGIDPEKIKKASIEKGIITEEEARKMNDEDAMFLIFKSGLSTAEKVTDISGRGVGMDIVKTHIEKLNGVIDIQSTIGKGTTFTIKLPLTLAIIRSLLVKFETFDFLGIAVKNENDVFVIQHINGDNVEHLKGKRFYMGEGLLGKAGILGKDFYWSKGIGAEKAEFLNRYGIFPKHLFGYVIKQNETVRSIIFGGSFHDEIISENLLKSIRFFIDLIVQKRMVQSKLHYYQYVKTIFDHFLDFLDIVMNMHDQKVIFHELLEFCYLLSNEKFACFTLNEEFVYKGKMDTEGMERHQLIASNKLSSIKIDERWLHFSIAFDHDHIGYYTLMMDNKNKQLMIYLLNLITALLNNKGEGEKKESSIFDLLYESMKEMNREQYQLADLSMKFAKKIMDILKIKDPQERLLNVCKILPFPMEFLENHIAHTEEWQMISKINYYLKGNESIKEESLELKILLFIYKLIIQKEDKERIDFLDRELYKIFMKVYRATCESPKDLLTEKKEGNGEHIEDMADLKSVISTLTLTPREKEILYLILEGLNNQEVGDYLNISVHTVKNHVTNIFKKLNVSDRIQAMVKIYRIKSGEQLYI